MNQHAIELEKASTPHRTAVTVAAEHSFPKQGKEAVTTMVDLRINGRVAGRFLHKTLRDNFRGNSYEAAVDQQLLKYERLKKLGLPVLPTFRIHAETRSMYFTYLKDGCEIFDNYHSMTLEDHQRITNLPEIEQQIKDIAVIAYDHGQGVKLSLDAYTVIVDPNGHAQVLLMDVGFGSFLLENGKARQVDWSEGEAMFEAIGFIDEVIYGNKEQVWFG